MVLGAENHKGTKLPLNVLIVEDEAVAALGLTMFLRELGHSVVDWALTADAAVEAAMLHRPDLVLMDVRLGDERDGISAAFEIWMRWDIPSVLITGCSDPDLMARAKMARPLEILRKPVPAHVLRWTLKGAAALAYAARD